MELTSELFTSMVNLLKGDMTDIAKLVRSLDIPISPLSSEPPARLQLDVVDENLGEAGSAATEVVEETKEESESDFTDSDTDSDDEEQKSTDKAKAKTKQQKKKKSLAAFGGKLNLKMAVKQMKGYSRIARALEKVDMGQHIQAFKDAELDSNTLLGMSEQEMRGGCVWVSVLTTLLVALMPFAVSRFARAGVLIELLPNIKLGPRARMLKELEALRDAHNVNLVVKAARHAGTFESCVVLCLLTPKCSLASYCTLV